MSLLWRSENDRNSKSGEIHDEFHRQNVKIHIDRCEKSRQNNIHDDSHFSYFFSEIFIVMPN